MSEPTLALQYSDLAGEVGLFAGWGRGAANGDPAWSTQQQAMIDSCVRSGLRRFYYPPPEQPGMSAYDWSFLRPVVILTLPISSNSLALPDDFGGFEDQITLKSTQSQVWCPVPLMGEGQLRARTAEFPNSTGKPSMAALTPIKGTTGTSGQRWQLLIWPTSDQQYLLQVSYYVNADYLNTAFPYHLGGPQHSETILESCLSVAEERLDDLMQGPHFMAFMRCLSASISADRKNKPQTLGYNRDHSDWRDRGSRGRPHWLDNLVTVNGVQY